MDLLFRTYYELVSNVSQTNGYGLFANEFIPKNKLVFSFGGKLLSKNDRYRSDVLRSTCIGLNDDIILCATTDFSKDISDYINHSCRPNVGLIDAISVVAIENIEKGSELFIDYRFWEYREEWKLKEECNCGAKDCSKYVNGSFYKTIDDNYPYFEYFSPVLKNKIINNI